METEHTKSELLYIEEHQSCQNYMTTIETGFKYLEFAKNAAFEEDNLSNPLQGRLGLLQTSSTDETPWKPNFP